MSSFLVIALSLAFCLLSIISFIISATVNKFFLRRSLKKVALFAVMVSALYEISFIVLRRGGKGFAHFLELISNYYLGSLLYALIISLVFWLFYGLAKLFKAKKIIKKLSSKKTAYILFAVFLLIMARAIYNFEKPLAVEKYLIETEKVSKPYTFVQVNDIQYGTIDREYMEDVMRLVYEQNPDFIVFIGDLIDANYYELEDFDVFKESKVPIFFERGNHEFYHDPERILSYLQQTQPIKTLINEKASFGELDIVGIDHNPSPDQLKEQLKKIELDEDRFSILIYHEPKGVEDALEKKFDLLLFAHTHAGQIWPITELIDYMYEYGDGYFEVENSIIYTSDGAALWGPHMRLDSQNEIVVFEIMPVSG